MTTADVIPSMQRWMAFDGGGRVLAEDLVSRVRAWVYNPERSRPSAEIQGEPEMLPLAAITVQLNPILLPLHARMTEMVRMAEPVN